jgi:alpha,alpha-trehalose phosphorylase
LTNRDITRLPESVYPIDDWKIIETEFNLSYLPQSETILSLGNGYLGLRGNLEEGTPVHESGTFVNGFHETWPIVYSETAYGYARTGQTILNLPDGKTLELTVDGEQLHLPSAKLPEYERTLDMRAGTLDRRLLWETSSGKQVRLISRRLVSFQHRNLAAISYQVTMLDSAATVVVSSRMETVPERVTDDVDPRKAPSFDEHPLKPLRDYCTGRRVMLGYQTRNSEMTLACGTDHDIQTACPHHTDTACSEDGGRVDITVDAEEGEPITITKYLTYHTSAGTPIDELCDRADGALDQAVGHGFDALATAQRDYLDDFWRRSDIRVAGNPALHGRPEGELQQAIRWNLYQILQAAGLADGSGVPAKGLTGRAYEGHYFWDSEIYILPFLIYTSPQLARHLLQFRLSMLDEARERAGELHLEGALFPWRTITGEEASAYYPGGTAQYHINADIVYALKKYVDVTGDTEFLDTGGVDVLVETARLWTSLGFYSARLGGRFCIHAVTGPDEYSAVVDDNLYTNLMARFNLNYAAASVATLRAGSPTRFKALVDRTGLAEAEIEDWRRAADAMYLPYDDTLGIHAQDSRFLERAVWDFANTPADHHPLLLHYHPLTIYRHQVIKQADVVLAMLLLGDEFPEDVKRRNFDYYDALTTGDSSLSTSIQSIVAAEVGDMDKAAAYGHEAVLLDLADLSGNTSDGVHVAAMGGAWMVIVYGFAGMRDLDGQLSFRPRLPSGIEHLSFPLTIRDRVLEVEVAVDTATYTLREGSDLAITHFAERVDLTPGVPESRTLPGN